MPAPITPRDQEAVRRELGLRVQGLRSARGWTQERLAEASDLDRSFIAQIESGRRNVSLGTLVKLASGLSIGLADLFGSGNTEVHDPD